MSKEPVANALYWQVQSAFPHLCAAATDQNDTVVATGRAVAFALDSAGCGALPDGGLDRIMIWAMNDRLTGVQPDIASAVEIAVGRDHQGTGLSHRMLRALRDAVRAAGLPADPWLRVHVRAGGQILRTAPASMVMVGSLAQWREWTGLAFDRTGDVIVPEALVPVRCDVDHDHAWRRRFSRRPAGFATPA